MSYRHHHLRRHAAIIGACMILAGCTVTDVYSPSIDRRTPTASIPVGPVPPAPVGPVAPSTATPFSPASNDLAPEVAVAVGIPTPLAPEQVGTAIYAPVTPPAPLVMEEATPAPLVIEQAAPTVRAPVVEAEPEKPGFFTRMASLTTRLLPGAGKALPGSEAANRRKLKSLDVTFEDVGTVGNPGRGRCGINNAVKVSAIGGVKIKPAATLNSEMAVAFAEWVRQDVVPAARSRYLSGVDSILNMSSYSCRTIGNVRGGRLSEHSFGNAIDIGKVTLNNGREVVVEKPGFLAMRQSSLLNKIRADACQRFTTVLGPGYNRAHADHFHFDLMVRNGRTCK